MIPAAFANKQPYLAHSDVLSWQYIGCDREKCGNSICERTISVIRLVGFAGLGGGSHNVGWGCGEIR